MQWNLLCRARSFGAGQTVGCGCLTCPTATYVQARVEAKVPEDMRDDITERCKVRLEERRERHGRAEALYSLDLENDVDHCVDIKENAGGKYAPQC